MSHVLPQQQLLLKLLIMSGEIAVNGNVEGSIFFFWRTLMKCKEAGWILWTEISSGAKTEITDIDFVVSMVEGEPRILDVRFQGLSVLETYRAEFIQQVFRAGVEGVLRGLRPRGNR